MGHQVVIYGMIECPAAGGRFAALKAQNIAILNSLPNEDEWPWLTRSQFALPGEHPQGTYHDQIIHFGLSLKDDTPYGFVVSLDPVTGLPKQDRECVQGWIDKFEQLLRKLFWYSANVHISTEFEPDRVFYYTPTRVAVDRMVSAEPQPIADWELKLALMPQE